MTESLRRERVCLRNGEEASVWGTVSQGERWGLSSERCTGRRSRKS